MNVLIRARDLAAGTAIWLSAMLIVGLFLFIVGKVAWMGAGALSLEFLLEAPQRGGRQGGIAPILVSTVAILVIAMSAVTPLGMGAAIFLSEVRGTSWPARITRRSLDVLAATPSIVFGLFGNAFFCIYLGMGFSLLSGGLTLACMALPFFVRIAEDGIRAVPLEYKQAAAALGLSHVGTLLHVVLPAAMPSLVAGAVLSFGRAIAETAALIFTSGYVDRMPTSIWDSGRALSVHIYDLSMNVAGGDRNASATALILITIVLTVNSLAGRLVERQRERMGT